MFTEGVCNEEILFIVVGEDVSCYVLPWGIWYISGMHRLDCFLVLVLGMELAMINIIGNVSIYSGTVDGGLGQVSHLLYASVIVVEISEHPLTQLRGYTHCLPLTVLHSLW